MKKKTLAAASLLLALLMPLGATPLAVYADEAQTGISAVSENLEDKDKDNTDENLENKDKDNTDENLENKDKDNTDENLEDKDKDNTDENLEDKDKDNTDKNLEDKDKDNTNGGSKAYALKSEEKVAATYGATPPSAEELGSRIWNSRNQVFYTTLKEATQNAQSGDTLYLGKGNYTLYGTKSDGITKGKDLTFVGSGVDVTAWNIGAEVPDPDKYGTEYNGDYSFDGAGTVTFKNMTLRSGSVDYLGFIRADKTVVDNCTINGETCYWGYTSATFKDTTFNPPSGRYALWTYSSPVMTFDTCTFNASGKVINVYTDAGAGENDITVNFNDCTVNSTLSIKPALNINDYNMGGYKYILNITNANVTAARDSVTCSQVFGFGGKAATNNTGRTDVNLDGELVFSAGKKLTHSYTDG